MDFETLFGSEQPNQNGSLDFASLFDPLPHANGSIDPTLLFDSQEPDHDWQKPLGLTGAPANPPDFTGTQPADQRMLNLTGKSPRLPGRQRGSPGGSPKHAPAQLYNVLKEAADQEAMARAERGQFLAKQAMAAVAYSTATGTSPALMPVVMDPTTGHTVALPLPSDNMQNVNWLNPYRPNRRRHCSPHLAAALGIADPSNTNNGFFVPPTMTGYFMPNAAAAAASLKVPMPAVSKTQPAINEQAVGEPMVPLMLPCTEDNFNNQDLKASPDSTTTASTSTSAPNNSTNTPPTLPLPPQSLDYFTQMELTRDQFLKEASSLDFSNVTVLEMKKLLRKFSLNATGKKAALQERIITTMTRLKNFTGRQTANAAAAGPTAEGNQTQHSAVTC